MFVKTCISLIIIGIGLSNGAPVGSVGLKVRHFRDLIPTRKEPDSTAMLDGVCRDFNHFKTDTDSFSKARRHVFVEAEFRLCDVENRQIAEKTLECVTSTIENDSEPSPKCESIANADLTASCSDKVTMELMFNCTILPVADKCSRTYEKDAKLDRMIDILYYFEAQLLVKPFKTDTCGSEFTQLVHGVRKSLEGATLMAEVFVREPIKK